MKMKIDLRRGASGRLRKNEEAIADIGCEMRGGMSVANEIF